MTTWLIVDRHHITTIEIKRLGALEFGDEIDDISDFHFEISFPIGLLFCQFRDMITSSNGNICRVTGHLCGEFTGPGEFPAQRPVTRNFDVFFDLRLNKRLSKQSIAPIMTPL